MFSSSAETFSKPFSVSSALLRCSAFIPPIRSVSSWSSTRQPRPALPHPREPQHRHRLVGLDLAEPLHDPPDPPRAHARAARRRRSACAPPGRSGNPPPSPPHRRRSGSPQGSPPRTTRRASRRSPSSPSASSTRIRAEVSRVPGASASQSSGKTLKVCASNGRSATPCAEDRVGHELGMALPLQLVPPDLRRSNASRPAADAAPRTGPAARSDAPGPAPGPAAPASFGCLMARYAARHGASSDGKGRA